MNLRLAVAASILGLAVVACGGGIEGDDVGGSSSEEGDGGGKARNKDGSYDDFPLCPPQPPLPGEPCDSNGQTCSYFWPGPPQCTQRITCTNDLWVYDGTSPCWH
jgi:hypothetical protein